MGIDREGGGPWGGPLFVTMMKSLLQLSLDRGKKPGKWWYRFKVRPAIPFMLLLIIL